LRRAGALALLALALAGCGGDDDESSSASADDSRCEPATSAIMTPLGNALTNKQDRLVNGQLVKSADHDDIWFVSAELDGPGFRDPGEVGTWATTSPGGGEAIYSVDEIAKDHTSWRDGTAIAGLSLDDEGAMESRECVSG
jgi:hypothetical protein